MAETRRHSLKPLRRLLPYVARYRGVALGAAVSLVFAALSTLVLPVAVRRMIDHGFSESDSAFIASYFSMLIVVAAVLALASAARYYFVVTLGEHVVADLRTDVFRHVTALSPSFFDSAQSGEIVSRLAADTTQIKATVGSTISQALRNVIMGSGAIVMMVITSPKLSGLVIVAIPVIVLPLVAFGRSVRRKSRAAQDTLAHATAYASEQIGAIRTLQAFTNEAMATSRFGKAVATAFEAARSSTLARAVLTFIAIFAVFSSVVAVLWFGSRDVLSGAITGGTLGQFLLYSVLAASALGGLSETWGDLSLASGAAERLSELLSEVPAIRKPDNATPMPAKPIGSVEFRGVSFAYPARSEMQALHDLSFTINPGEKVALVGPSGAGKSTVLSLILRFYDPQQGAVLVDGVDITKVDPAELRSRIAIVPQDVTVFAATAGENIGFGKPEAGNEQIEAAARAAFAEDFIRKLPQGFDQQVGERGVMLSGGQRQRIAIARAILRDAPVLLLDEATSALDAESESAVQEALESLMQGRTSIVIAHRLATVLKADRILVIDGGRIVEEGRHEQLVAQGGLYARLAELQFAGGNADFVKAAE